MPGLRSRGADEGAQQSEGRRLSVVAGVAHSIAIAANLIRVTHAGAVVELVRIEHCNGIPAMPVAPKFLHRRRPYAGRPRICSRSTGSRLEPVSLPRSSQAIEGVTTCGP